MDTERKMGYINKRKRQQRREHVKKIYNIISHILGWV